MISPTDGSRTIATALDVFIGAIDKIFDRWGTNKPELPAKETPILAYELAQDATFAQMFSSLSPDLDKLCLTQAQIIEFVATHPNQLRTECCGNFFLFKSTGKPTGKLFVASVLSSDAGAFHADVCQFDDTHIWNSELHHRLFVPQLA